MKGYCKAWEIISHLYNLKFNLNSQIYNNLTEKFLNYAKNHDLLIHFRWLVGKKQLTKFLNYQKVILKTLPFRDPYSF